MNQPSGLEWKAYIGDQMLFLGKNHSKSILAIGFLAGFKGNCIYYTDDRTVCLFTLVYQHKEKLRVFCLDECRNKKFLPKIIDLSFSLIHLKNPQFLTLSDSCNN